ncbi:MAG: COX15/CtaA family protein [Elusimicrobia bacterium]|nr:COX15/CtaA family protein [Elusimicrobiota bacterium]
MRSLARLTASAAFVLLIAGGLVTSTRSGLAVPDWPLSFGQLFPPMLGGVLFEHGHRLIAGAVGLLTLALSLWVLRSDRRAWVRGYAVAASAAILLQAALGGLTVIWRLPAAISISHACLAQAVFCLILTLVEAYGPEAPTGTIPSGVWRPGALAMGAIFLQLILGAKLRHTAQGLWLHALWAVGVLFFAGFLVKHAMLGAQESRLRGPGLALAFLLPAQIGLGLLSYRVRFLDAPNLWPSAFFTTSHLALGALMLGSCWIWTLRAYRAQ